MWARRYMIETGATEHDLAAAAINARRHAVRNPRAMRRTPLTEEEYFASPMVADPYRTVDCTVEVDGACALLVTSLERARDLALPPAVIAGSGWRTHRFDLDMASILTYDAPSRNYLCYLRDELWGGAGITPASCCRTSRGWASANSAAPARICGSRWAAAGAPSSTRPAVCSPKAICTA
jgi:acetyl-CoA acetyltransferase